MAHPCYVCTFYPVPDGDGVECPHCHRLQYGNMCPFCGQNSPTVIKGLRVVCGACGRERGPLSGGLPMNIAGKPSQVGGFLAGVFGWTTLAGSVFLSLLAVALFVFTTWGILHVLGSVLGFFALIGFLISWFVLGRGRRLAKRGDTAGRHAREQAIFALAQNRGGILTATDVSNALNMQHADADAMLTAMAREGTHVGVEVDAQGVVHYVFKELRPPVQVQPGVRVDAGVIPPSPDEVRAKVDQEFAQIRAINDMGKRGQ